MALTETFCRVASLRPADTNEAQLYVVPASTEVIGVLRICNQDTSASTFRIAHCAAGHGDTAANGDEFLFYDKAIPASETFELSITAKPTETLRVKAGAANKISFHLSGCLKVTS